MAPTFAAVLDRALDRIERAKGLDSFSAPLASALRRVLRPAAVKDAASGTPVGHPLHPLLVAVPIGAWTAASYLDLVGDRSDRVAARRLVGLGAVAAAPAVLTGASDWTDTMGAERRVGVVHALANHAALSAYVGSWFARRRGRHGLGVALAALGGTAMTVGGWLGGHLAYGLGVGVDTTAFQSAPAEWVDAAPEGDVVDGTALGVEVDGVPVLLTRAGGAVVALADRCTHRGAPLHEGELSDGCVTCPWHGSRFALDGTIRRGPATRPQLRYETRTVNGRVQVRHAAEERTLRTNPVGH